MMRSLVSKMGDCMETVSNRVEVIIDGQKVKLTAHESAEYIQEVARYIDEKVSEVNKLKSGSSTDSVTRWLLVALNIADELFKEREKKTEHEAEPLDSGLDSIREENLMLNEKIAELQTELAQVRKEFDDFLEAFGN